MSNWKTEFLGLYVRQLREKVRLVLDRVGRGSQPEALLFVAEGLGIVARGDEVVVVAHALVESTKFDKAVAHNIRIGGESLADSVDDIGRHAFVVGLLEVYHLEWQIVLAGSECGEFNVLLGRARCAFALHTYFNVVKVGTDARLAEQVAGNGAVHPARDEEGISLRGVNLKHDWGVLGYGHRCFCLAKLRIFQRKYPACGPFVSNRMLR